MKRNRSLSIVFLLCPFLIVAGCGGDHGHSNAGGAERASASHTGSRFVTASPEENGTQAGYAPTGRIVANSGFKPDADGFQFANYPPPLGNQDMGAAEMEDLFGQQVCQSSSEGGCVLTQSAGNWMATENQYMSGGHCFGFSVTSLLMFEGQLDPHDYDGASQAYLLDIGTIELQRRIAESWALQDVNYDYGQDAKAPNAMLRFLTTHLSNGKSASYTFIVYSPDPTAPGGHAITPYAVEEKGNGKAAVLVWDNNYPGRTRAVMFDRRKNSWSYTMWAGTVWHGHGRTNRPALYPTSRAPRTHACPFCGAPAAAKPDVVSLVGDSVNHGHLLITDSDDNRTGYVDGRFVDEIPGAELMPRIDAQIWEQSPEPRYRIPNDADVSILLDGTTLKAPDTESVSIIGAGHNAAVTNITLRPGDQNRVELTPGNAGLVYRTDPDSTQSPRLTLGLEQKGPDLQFVVTPSTIAGGSTLSAKLRLRKGRLAVNATGVKNSGRYALNVTKFKSSGARTSSGKVVRVASGKKTRLSYREHGRG